jgi:hypothetical protein
MSLSNPIDYTGFSSPFNVDLAVNARNKADAYTKSQAALRAGALGGSAASFLGKAHGQKFMDEAGAFVQQQGQNADMFGKAMGAVGSIGSFAAMGGFGGGAAMKGPSVGTFDGAFNTGLDVGGFTPSEILSNPNIGYTPFG